MVLDQRHADLAEVRTGVEVAIAGLAASRIDAEGTLAITEALEREAKTPEEEQPDSCTTCTLRSRRQSATGCLS